MCLIISQKLEKVWLLSKINNGKEDANALMVWDKNIIEKKTAICISLRVVASLSDNIGTRAEVDIFV